MMNKNEIIKGKKRNNSNVTFNVARLLRLCCKAKIDYYGECGATCLLPGEESNKTHGRFGSLKGRNFY
jgi:hypothetical protein